MAPNANISIVVSAIDQATKTLRAVSKGMREMGGEWSALSAWIRSLGDSIRGNLVTAAKASSLALAWLGAAWVKSAMWFEQTATAFNVMLKDGEKAGALLKDLAKFAETTPYEFPEIANAGKSLLAFGFDAKDVNGTLRTLGDIASSLNIPLGDLSDIYGKARTQWRLFSEDINQLTGRGIPIIQELAKQFGVSESKVRDLVEKGKVWFPQLEAAFKSMSTWSGQFAGGMEKQSKTLSGLLSTLQDNVSSTLRAILGMKDDGTIEKWSVLEKLKESAASLSDYLTKNKEWIVKAVTDIASGAKKLFDDIAPVVKAVYDWAKENPKLTETIIVLTGALALLAAVLPAISAWISALSVLWLVIPVVKNVAFAFMAFSWWAATLWEALLFAAWWPVVVIIAALAALSVAGYLVYKNWDSIKKKTSEIWHDIGWSVDFALRKAKKAAEIFSLGASKTISDATAFISSSFDKLVSSAKQWWSNLVWMVEEWIRSKISDLTKSVASAASVISDYLGFHSPTKKGPNSDADRWMPNLFSMLLWGMGDGEKRMTAAAVKIAQWMKTSMNVEQFSDFVDKVKWIASQAQSAFSSLSSWADSQRSSVKALADEYRNMKRSLSEYVASWAKEVQALTEKLRDQQKAMQSTRSEWKSDVANRALEVQKRLDEIRWGSTTDAGEMTRLNAELELAKTYVSNAEIEKARLEASKSETQLIIDRTQKKLEEQGVALAAIVGERDEKIRAIEAEKTKQTELLEQKKQQIREERDAYAKLVSDKTLIDRLYFKIFRDQIDKSKDEVRNVISLLEQANSLRSWSVPQEVSWARADGGPVSSGKTYLVWEKGPELFVPWRSGTIVPNGSLWWGVSVTVNFWGVTVGSQSDIRALTDAVSERLTRQLQLYKLGSA